MSVEAPPQPELGIDAAYDRIEELTAQLDVHRTRSAELRSEIAGLRKCIRQEIGRRERVLTVATLGGPFTAAEERLLPYLRSGLTNADIASELYVSIDTVKTHLKNIYRKLGVEDRAAAATALADRGLTRPAETKAAAS